MSFDSNFIEVPVGKLPVYGLKHDRWKTKQTIKGKQMEYQIIWIEDCDSAINAGKEIGETLKKNNTRELKQKLKRTGKSRPKKKTRKITSRFKDWMMLILRLRRMETSRKRKRQRLERDSKLRDGEILSSNSQTIYLRTEWHEAQNVMQKYYRYILTFTWIFI